MSICIHTHTNTLEFIPRDLGDEATCPCLKLLDPSLIPRSTISFLDLLLCIRPLIIYICLSECILINWWILARCSSFLFVILFSSSSLISSLSFRWYIYSTVLKTRCDIPNSWCRSIAFPWSKQCPGVCHIQRLKVDVRDWNAVEFDCL